MQSVGLGQMQRVTCTLESPPACHASDILSVTLRKAEDSTLVRRALLGDARAPQEVWRRFAPLVRGIVRRAVGLEGDVEDVVQDIFFCLFHKLSSLRDQSALRAFLVSISAQTVRHELRRRRVRRLVALSPAPEVLNRYWVSTDHDARQALRQLHELLLQLPSRERTAFALHFVDGVCIEDIARGLAISVPTTRRALARALRRIAIHARRDESLTPYLKRGGTAMTRPVGSQV